MSSGFADGPDGGRRRRADVRGDRVDGRARRRSTTATSAAASSSRPASAPRWRRRPGRSRSSTSTTTPSPARWPGPWRTGSPPGSTPGAWPRPPPSCGAPPPPADELAAIELPIAVEQSAAGDIGSPAAFFAPAMGLLFLFFTVGGLARSLLGERRAGMLDRMRVAPVAPAGILAGKALLTCRPRRAEPAGHLGRHVRRARGRLGGAARRRALIVAAALAVAGIAGLIAAVARTEQAADRLATALRSCSPWSAATSSRSGTCRRRSDASRCSRRTAWRCGASPSCPPAGAAPADVLPHVGALLAWAVVAGTLAALLLPRRLASR